MTHLQMANLLREIAGNYSAITGGKPGALTPVIENCITNNGALAPSFAWTDGDGETHRITITSL